MPETAKQKVARLKAEEAIRDRQIIRYIKRLRALRNRRHRLRVAIRKWTASIKQTKRPFEIGTFSVVNQSERIGGVAAIDLIVLHDTEGGTLEAIRAWFNNLKAKVSAHVVVDRDGQSIQCVPDERKAWHCAAFNSRSLGIEQIGFSTQTEWPDQQLLKTAEYIAYWSGKYGIPIVHSTTNGVCLHSELGAAGGGHSDPGDAYPLGRVLALARAMR